MATFFTVMIYLAGVVFIAGGIGFWGWPSAAAGFIILGLGGLHEMLREIKATLIARSAPTQPARPGTDWKGWPEPNKDAGE